MGYWLAINEENKECLFIGENEPKKENGKVTFDGDVIVLPKCSIRNLTQKIVTFDDEPIKFTTKLSRKVSYFRDNKNAIIKRLLKEKYGENNEQAGFLKELYDMLQKAQK